MNKDLYEYMYFLDIENKNITETFTYNKFSKEDYNLILEDKCSYSLESIKEPSFDLISLYKIPKVEIELFNDDMSYIATITLDYKVEDEDKLKRELSKAIMNEMDKRYKEIFYYLKEKTDE